MAPPNPTGFNIKTFANAATSPEWRARDPWKRAEAWRYTGPFTRWNRLKGAFPGFGIGLGAFLAYWAFETAFLKDSHGHEHSQGHGHDEKHH